MNINSKLIAFAQNELVISHTEVEREKIKTSVGQLEKVLKAKLGSNIKEFVRFGSFTRNTILPRKYDPDSDIDLMVIFNTSSEIKKPETYRNWILDSVSISYLNSISKKDFPAIKLLLNHIMFDIVPSYSEINYFGLKNYYIPDKDNKWRRTTPNDINDSLATKNTQYGNNIIRNTIRLCKHWNAFAGYPLESYLMEKDIISFTYLANDNTYDCFLKTLNSIAGEISGVRQALDYIQQYKGTRSQPANEAKQFEWLQKLLPGLK